MKTINYIFNLLCLIIILPAQNYSILFTKQEKRNDNIFMFSSGGKEKQITNHQRKDSSPILSHDGRYIVFTSERVGWWKIWTLDLKEKKFQQLTNSNSAEYSPFWSPSGDQIVFVSSRDGDSELYTMAKDGKDLKNITNNEVNDIMPFWGSDGFIYYSVELNGNYQIAKVKPNGTSKAVLTSTPSNKFMPQISPSMKEILFYSDMDGNLEIYTMEIASKKMKRLTKNPLKDMRPRWSPDGSKIVFERGNKKNNQHIYIMNSDGSKQIQITTSGYNYSPSFASIDHFLK